MLETDVNRLSHSLQRGYIVNSWYTYHMQTLDNQTTLTRIKELLAYYRAGVIPTLAQHEVNPGLDKGGRENYLYFTLPVCINFQRSSPAMWQAALATWSDTSTRFVFYPEEVTRRPIEEVRAGLLKHKLALQPNRHTLIWVTIAQTLHDHFQDDPRVIIQQAGRDVLQLLAILQQSHKPYFPYLSGPKLSNYWPYILSRYTDVTFVNSHEISIIPDTHVIQSSIKLGLASEGANALQVVEAWRNILGGSGISPVEMHPVLWNWSRAGFLPNV